MSPYRRPALRYIAPGALKTPLKRKIKFAWNYANNINSLLNVNSLFGFIYLPIAIVCLPFERQMIFPIGLIIVVMLATMLWSWCSFFIQAKRRNEHAKRMDRLQTNMNYSYMCGSCNSCFQSHEHAVLHVFRCHTETTIINEV